MPVARVGRPALLGVALLAFGWWVVGLEPFTTGTTVAVLGAGGAAALAGAAMPPRPPRGESGRPQRASAVPWGGLVGVLVAVQLLAFTQEPRGDHPTLSHLTNAVLDPRPVRAAVFVAWLLLAARLARR